jgi:phosphonate transport system ATP-binding protein
MSDVSTGVAAQAATLVSFQNTSVTYPNGFTALKDVTLDLHEGEFIVVVGLSGAGKSTLIRTINRLVAPTGGDVTVLGTPIRNISDANLRKTRRRIGMIFQNYNLVRRSSVLANVLTGRLGDQPTWRALLGLYTKADTELAI